MALGEIVELEDFNKLQKAFSFFGMIGFPVKSEVPSWPQPPNNKATTTNEINDPGSFILSPHPRLIVPPFVTTMPLEV